MLGIPRQTLQYKLSSTTKPPNNWRFLCVCTNKRAFTYIKSNEYDSMYGFHTVLKNIFRLYNRVIRTFTYQ